MSSSAQAALVIIATVNVIGLIALALLAYGIFRQLRAFNERARPVLREAETVLGTVKSTAAAVGERAEKVTGDVAAKAERIVELTEQMAERVGQRVDTTSAIVQEAITHPAIHVASVRAGIGKGLEVWQELSRGKGGDGK